MRKGFVAAALLTVVLLAACVMPGGKATSRAANPITGTPIATSSLDAPGATPTAPEKPVGKVIGQDPAPLLEPPPSGFVDASEDAIKAAEAMTAPAKGATDPDPAKAKTETSADATKATAADAAAKDTPPAEPQSPAEAKCLKSGGTWATAGKGDAKSCVRATRDAGKACTRQTQCEGLCLARSGTCAPITPLFGCNDIFQADGRRVTLCLD